MKNKFLALAGGLVVTTGSFLIPETAQAFTFTFGPGGEYSGTNEPLSGEVTATIAPNGTDSATVTIDTFGLDTSVFPSEFVVGLYLNTDPDKAYSGGFSFSDGGGTQDYSSATFNPNGFQADGDGSYDILISFPTSGDRFEADESSTIIITAAGLEAGDLYNFLSEDPGSAGPFGAVLRVRGTGVNGDGSGWYEPVPEPLTILGTGLALGFGGLFKKKYGQKKNEVS